MRRKLIFIMLITAILLLAACGSSDAAPGADDTGGEVDAGADPVEDTGGAEDAVDSTDPVDEGSTDEQPPADEAPAEPVAFPTVDINCTDTNPHPLGQSIADTHGYSYEEVMTWFCSGDTFDDVLLAIQTSKDSGIDVQTLLDMAYDAGGDWEQVWDDLGLYQ